MKHLSMGVYTIINRTYGGHILRIAIEILVLSILLLAGAVGAFSVDEWNKTFGGKDQDYGYSTKPTSDGGYILAGISGSDSLLVKTDKDGNKQWEQTFGGSSDEYVYSVEETSDGGYIFVGSTRSTVSPYDEKGWIVKVKKDGTKEWEKITGKGFKSISRTSDKGFILAGICQQACLVKLDKDGNEVWTNNSNVGHDAVSAKETSDGNYVMAVNGNYPLTWVIKADPNGKEISRKLFNKDSKANASIATDIEPTLDGGYVLAGYNRTSDSSQPSGYKVLGWLIKTNSNDSMAWTKVYEESNVYNFIISVAKTKDGGFALGGTRRPSDGTEKGLIIKTDINGNENWRKVSNETNKNHFQSIEETKDGGYILAGSILSSETGSTDAWLVKLSSDTSAPTTTVNITANPDTHDINVSTNFTFTANPVGSWGNNISYSWSIAYEKCSMATSELTGQTISEYLDVECGNATISLTAGDEKGNVANDTYLVIVRENATSPPTLTVMPVLTTITVSPSTTALNITEIQLLIATALDQNKMPMSGINISWTTSNSTVGNITPLFAVTGIDGKALTLFIALVNGTTTVKATNGTVSGSSDVTVAAVTPTQPIGQPGQPIGQQPGQGGTPPVYCIGGDPSQPCGQRPVVIRPIESEPGGPTPEQIQNGVLCGVEFLPGGGAIGKIKDVTQIGNILIGTIEDVSTGKSYRVILEFVPYESCFELIGSLTPIQKVY